MMKSKSMSVIGSQHGTLRKSHDMIFIEKVEGGLSVTFYKSLGIHRAMGKPIDQRDVI
jgi:hypothetical protein